MTERGDACLQDVLRFAAGVSTDNNLHPVIPSKDGIHIFVGWIARQSAIRRIDPMQAWATEAQIAAALRASQ